MRDKDPDLFSVVDLSAFPVEYVDHLDFELRL